MGSVSYLLASDLCGKEEFHWKTRRSLLAADTLMWGLTRISKKKADFELFVLGLDFQLGSELGSRWAWAEGSSTRSPCCASASDFHSGDTVYVGVKGSLEQVRVEGAIGGGSDADEHQGGTEW